MPPDPPVTTRTTTRSSVRAAPSGPPPPWKRNTHAFQPNRTPATRPRRRVQQTRQAADQRHLRGGDSRGAHPGGDHLPGIASAATQICSNQTGTNGGYYYQMWTNGQGSACITLNSGNSYSTSWSGIGDFVAGVGWNPGSNQTRSTSPAA